MSKKDDFLDRLDIVLLTLGAVKLFNWLKKKKAEELAQKASNKAKSEPSKPTGQATTDGKTETVEETKTEPSTSTSDCTQQTTSKPVTETPSKETHPDKENSAPEFRHSLDFYTVNYNENEYLFSPNQARVVQRLYEAYENKTPCVHQSTLLEGLDIYSQRMRDVFKNSPAWSTLIVPGKVKGTYRLNLSQSAVSLSH